MNSVGGRAYISSPRPGRSRIELPVVKPLRRALAEINEHLEALAGIGRFVIQPYASAVPLVRVPAREHAIGSRLDIQIGPYPPYAVFAVRISCPIEPSSVVPHLEKTIFGIVEHSILKRTSYGTIAIVHFQGGLRLQYWARLMNARLVKRARDALFRL